MFFMIIDCFAFQVLEILCTNSLESISTDVLNKGIDSILKHAKLVADFPFHLYDQDIRSLSSEVSSDCM